MNVLLGIEDDSEVQMVLKLTKKTNFRKKENKITQKAVLQDCTDIPERFWY